MIITFFVCANVASKPSSLRDEIVDELKTRPDIERRMKKYALTPMFLDASAYTVEE